MRLLRGSTPTKLRSILVGEQPGALANVIGACHGVKICSHYARLRGCMLVVFPIDQRQEQSFPYQDPCRGPVILAGNNQ